MINLLSRVFLLLALLSLLAGCGTTLESRLLHFQVDENANRNTPVAIDLVAVNEMALLQRLSRIAAWEWFGQRQQLQQDFPFHLQVWSWEVVPGDTLEPFEIPKAARQAEGLLLFARYTTPGLHRVRLGPFEELLLHLTEHELRVRVIRQEGP